MSTLHAHIDGIGLYGPGLNGWAQASEVLRGAAPYQMADLALPAPDALPPAERRRAGLPLKLAMAAGFDAVRGAGADPRTLATVFSSGGSDGDNCHRLLESLAASERAVSPTQFHNSVHNMAAGYWGIATGCMAASTSLCAYDASFAAGLLEAATQIAMSGRPCLLVVFDTVYPPPLHAVRPLPCSFGLGLMLSPARSKATQASVALELTDAAPTQMVEPELEELRRQVPTARGLPLLKRIARGETGEVVIDCFEPLQLRVNLS
ncbi:MAG: beta-ketoacyl synthase chain length factor [Proteobacteria bacterium]|nr:beta-ketoacyl synthase chain length factor [Pseudomonadota bacterium]